jgi:hypothetical protein
MKRWILRGGAAAAVLLLCSFFAAALLFFTQPMSKKTFDLSVGKVQWEVYTQEGEQRTDLLPDGDIGYTGLSAAGQTFYFSRILTEKVESPVLYLDTVNRGVAVFLDGERLYTDCPEQSGGVGELTLPMLGWDRLEPVKVSLPQDYQGKRLTIAQSTGLGEKQIPETEPTVYPCTVTLSCGYAYESGIIAESFKTAIPAALCFVLGLLLSAAFLWQGFRGRWDIGLLIFSLAAFFIMLVPLGGVSFFGRYLPYPKADLNALSHAMCLTALLIFLGSRGVGRLRWILWGTAALHGLTALLGRASVASLLTVASEYLGLWGLLAAAVLSLVWMKQGNHFYRLFAPLLLAALGLGLAAYGVRTLADPQWGCELIVRLQTSFQNGLPRVLLWRWSALTMVASTAAAFIDLFRREAQRRTEERLLLQRGELIRENYENLRKHNKEVQTLRHDLRHHVTALQGLCREGDMEEIRKYLENLSQRPELNRSSGYTVHPAVDAVLTAMLARGAEAGVRAEVRVELPPELPIPNSDLCPLLMNLLENALEANEKAPEGAEKWLRVTIHISGVYLYVGVENARFSPVEFDPEDHLYRSTKPGTLHGMGLKSARATARKYHSELILNAAEDSFSASTALLLPETET